MPYAIYEEGLEHRREYQKTPEGMARHVAANLAYRHRHRDRLRCHNAVAKAIRSGKLKPWPVCAMPECNCTVIQAHHPDYSAPLSVVWLCDAHHKAAHALV